MALNERELRQRIEFIPDRLYYVSLTSLPPLSARSDKYFFSIDQELIYWNFYLDFGPLNLGHLHKFLYILNNRLADPQLKDKTIYFYSGTHPHKRANAAFLIASWAMLCLHWTPEESFKPFKMASAVFPPWVSDIVAYLCLSLSLTVCISPSSPVTFICHITFITSNLYMSYHLHHQQP